MSSLKTIVNTLDQKTPDLTKQITLIITTQINKIWGKKWRC